MSKAGGGFAEVVLIFAFFCLMSRIDFIVNGTLYQYGLQFSYSWATEYWVMYDFSFVCISVVMALMYWLGSDKTTRDRRISVGLFATINILMIGGLQDLLFYTFWDGGLPPDSIVWWWNPLSHVFGTWNTSMQIALTASACSVTLLLWSYVLGKPDVPVPLQTRGSISLGHATLSCEKLGPETSFCTATTPRSRERTGRRNRRGAVQPPINRLLCELAPERGPSSPYQTRCQTISRRRNSCRSKSPADNRQETRYPYQRQPR